MSKAMKAVLMIAEHPEMTSVLLPLMNFERREIRWDQIEPASLSREQQAALSWAYCIWKDSQVDPTTRMTDPFEGFSEMSRSLQACVVNALAQRI